MEKEKNKSPQEKNKPLKHRNAYPKAPYTKKPYRNNNRNQNRPYKPRYYKKDNNNVEEKKIEKAELEKSIQSALTQEDILAFEYENNKEFIDMTESTIAKKEVKLEIDDFIQEEIEDNETEDNKEADITLPTPSPQEDKNTCVEKGTSSQILFGVATQEQFINTAKAHLMKLHDKGEMDVFVKGHPYTTFGKKCLIIPYIMVNNLGLGNKPLPFNILHGILCENDIFVAERIGKFNILKQDWVLYEDIGIKLLTDISKNGKYPNEAIMQIAFMAAALHSIPIEDLRPLNEHLPTNNSIEWFTNSYQRFIRGYSEGVSRGTGNIYTLFRFPKDKSEWLSIPATLPYSKKICLCAINYSPSNIFITDDYQTIISDWSLAGFAPATYDLANIIYSLRLDTKQEKVLLNTYSDILNIQNKNLHKEINIFKSLFIAKEAIDLLAGSYFSVRQEKLKAKDAEPVTDMLFDVIKSAYKVWNYPEEKILAKESMLAVVRKWIRDKGPGKDEWIPECENLDDFLKQHMSIYQEIVFYTPSK